MEDDLLEIGGSLELPYAVVASPSAIHDFVSRSGDGDFVGNGGYQGEGGGNGGYQGDGGDGAVGGYGDGSRDGGYGAGGDGQTDGGGGGSKAESLGSVPSSGGAPAGVFGYNKGEDRKLSREEAAMRDGEPAIVVSPCGSYPYVRIGRCHHVRGDEWEIRDVRVIKKFGRGVALSVLAADGPAKDTELLPKSAVEYVHRLHATRVIPASEAVLKKFMEV